MKGSDGRGVEQRIYRRGEEVNKKAEMFRKMTPTQEGPGKNRQEGYTILGLKVADSCKDGELEAFQKRGLDSSCCYRSVVQ